MHIKRFVLLAFFICPPCLAENWPLPLFTSDPRSVLAAAARYQFGQEISALILDYSIDAQIDESGRLRKVTRIVSKVMRVQGIEPVQTLSVPWSLARENRPLIKARVITSDGQPHLLDENGINEQDPRNANYVGAIKILSVTLPEVNIDSVVEVQIEEGSREPALPGGRFADVTLQTGLPVLHFKMAITSRAAAELHVETRSFRGAKITPEPAQKGHAVSVEASNFIPSPAGAFLPPEIAPLATVAFSNVPQWQSVAQWYSEALAKVLPAPAPAQAPTGPGELSTVEKIYEDLRNHVHDNGRDLAYGAVVPNPPALTLKAGVADSKDEAVLLIAKLTEAGISAKLALISAAPHSDVAPTLPGFEAFNHALVYIPGPAPLWIDPAAEYTPVARLPVADQDRWALVIDPTTAQLVHTPVSTEKDNHQTIDTEFRLGDGNPTRISLTMQPAGSFEDTVRSVISQIAAAKADEKLNIAGQLLRGAGGQEAVSTKSSDAHRLLEKTWLEIAGEGYPYAVVTDDGGYVDVPGLARLNLLKLSSLLQANPSPGRNVDFYVAPPFTSETRYHVIPPLGYRLKQPAAIAPVNLGPVSIVTNMKLDKDGTLWLSYALTQPKIRLMPQEVEAMRNDLRKIANNNSIRIELENIATAKMNSGDFIEGLKLLRQDVDAAKDTVNPALRLASGYTIAGARSAGLKLCEDLLKRNSGEGASDADIATIHARIAWIYLHDEFGRMLVPGMNAAEAEKHFRAALALIPNSAMAWLELADLYTYNAAAIHDGRSARLNDAIQIYSKLDLDTVARAGKLNDYALLLLQARKYSELREFFLYPQADAADQSIKWAGVAAANSESDFREELAFRLASAKDLRAVLVQAGRHLVAIREYQAAARVFRLAGKSAIPQPELDRLDRVRVFDETAVSKQPAIAAFQRYVQAVLDPINVDDWKKFVSAGQESSTLEVQRHALLERFGALAGPAASQDTWPYLVDLIDTTLNLTAEGSDQAGFRVNVPGLGNAASTTVAYVMKQGNEYVIAPEKSNAAPQAPQPDSLAALRQQEYSLAEQGNYVAAAAVAKQICANANASPVDWNDLAWTILFTQQNAADARAAAEKAAQLTNLRIPAILHTLAVAQASTGQLKDAIATGYKFADISGEPGEMYTLFGRIAEEVGLLDTASEYYGRVPKEQGIRLSNYAFAQMRLAVMRSRSKRGDQKARNLDVRHATQLHT